MLTLRRFVVAALVLGLLAIGVVGAAWKWQHGPNDGYGQQRLAGWTWDDGTTAPDPGNGNAYGHANNNSNPNNNTDPNNTGSSNPTP